MAIAKSHWWKLTAPIAFEGKSGLIDAIRMVRIDNLNLDDATIVFNEGWIVVSGDDAEFRCPNITRAWRWNDATYAIESAKVPPVGLPRRQDLFSLFYRKLAASDPKYAGTLVHAGDTV